MAVVGLDIGGSTTRAVRAEDGRCVAEARAGSANIRSVGPAEAARQLDAVLAGIKTDDVAAVCAGAAGGDSAPARAALGELLERGHGGPFKGSRPYRVTLPEGTLGLTNGEARTPQARAAPRD